MVNEENPINKLYLATGPIASRLLQRRMQMKAIAEIQSKDAELFLVLEKETKEIEKTSRASKRKFQEFSNYPKRVGENFILGPNGTQIDMKSYESMIWSSPSDATRQLLCSLFSTETLCTHTLTGKASPAFQNRVRSDKKSLDSGIIGDIIYCVQAKFDCSEKEIKHAITIKCFDTSKCYNIQNPTEDCNELSD